MKWIANEGRPSTMDRNWCVGWAARIAALSRWPSAKTAVHGITSKTNAFEVSYKKKKKRWKLKCLLIYWTIFLLSKLRFAWLSICKAKRFEFGVDGPSGIRPEPRRVRILVWSSEHRNLLIGNLKLNVFKLKARVFTCRAYSFTADENRCYLSGDDSVSHSTGLSNS